MNRTRTLEKTIVASAEKVRFRGDSTSQMKGVRRLYACVLKFACLDSDLP